MSAPDLASVDASAPAVDPSVSAAMPVDVEDEPRPVRPVPTSDTRVLAVLVAHDGGPWLDRTLSALAAQTHPHLEVVAVDNGSSDDSRARLLAHLGPEQILVADRDLGFGAAVSMALDARSVDTAPYVLLIHDDLALEPDAVATLAAAMDDDPRLAIAGPKLLEWYDRRRLQSVGWTVDITGRADSGVDEGELDQGQRDIDRRTLYVSTAGMLIRRDVFDDLGRFDRRFHLFRDDLDLCWRAWLAGHDVEVVPEAVGGHAASAANYERLGQTRFLGPRYFAERNTLATLLKNYGPARLAAVIPLYAVVGIAKVLGFVMTRRFSDAWQTVRAWLWNALHIVETGRLRGQVQASRTRSDGELKDLFGRIAPRIRAYAEAIGDWIAGGDAAPVTPEVEPEVVPEPETATVRLVRAVRTRPVMLVGGLLTVLVMTGAASLLVPGQLRGGELAPWPASPSAFFADHAAAWHTATGLGTAADPSPAQAMLGLLHVAVVGSPYLAPRVLLLGSLLLAWVFALRATQRYSDRKLPRVAAATAYVLSPPALAALTTGQIGALLVLAALPGIVAAGGTLANPRTPPASAWRAAAGAALLGAVAGAFVPWLLPLFAITGIGLLVTFVPSAPDHWRWPLTSRVLLAALGPWFLLLPWSLRLFTADGPLFGGVSAAPLDSELWRWVLMVPEVAGFPGVLAGVGFLAAGVLGMVFGWRRQAGLVATLWSLAFLGAVVGWSLARAGSPVWPGLPSLLSAAAFSGLLAVAFARAETTLGPHAFGWRQIAAVTTGVAVLVSLATVAFGLLTGADRTYLRDVAALPPFVTASATEDDPFRVLLLADVGGEIIHEVVPGSGPTAVAIGVPYDPDTVARVDHAVADLVTGRDVHATATLGALGVRFVVVPDGGVSTTLDQALRGQVGLEPRPVSTGRVLEVRDALPRASIVSRRAATIFARTGRLPEGTAVDPIPVGPDGGVATTAPAAGVVLLSEFAGSDWEASADAVALDPFEAPTVAFAVPEVGAELEVRHAGQAARSLALAGQLLAVLLVISLMLRPPGFARVGIVDVEAAP